MYFTLQYLPQGGMKAVIWTDALQMSIMIIGMLTLTIIGAQKAGGGQHVYEYAKANNRFNFDVYVQFLVNLLYYIVVDAIHVTNS